MNESLKKYRYFIIPRFNQCYNVEKIETLGVSKISSIHSRYFEGNNNSTLCVILLYTSRECTEQEIRDSFSPIFTSKNYITIEEKRCKSTRLFFFSTYPPHKTQSGVKNLLNTFAKNNYSVVPANDNSNNCNYWIIDFRNTGLAKHAINFIPKIPFENSAIFISENPFNIPLVQIQGFSPIQSYFTKNPDFADYQLDYPKKSCLTSENNYSFVLAKNITFSNTIINTINYTQYKDHTLIAQCFLPELYISFMHCFKIKVRIPDANLNIRSFYSEMNKIGPVYQVFENEEDANSFCVIFKNRRALRSLFNDKKYSVSFANCSIFTIYNFPPKTSEFNIQGYMEKAGIKYFSIEKCDKKKNILPSFRICIDFGSEDKFQSFFNDEKCIYNKKTRPFCIKYLFEHEYGSLCEQIINKSNTIQVLSHTAKTVTDIYNEYSRFGCINLLFFNPDIHRYSITYADHNQYLKAKQYMDSNYPQTKKIVVEKEKSVSEKIISGNKINIEIKKSSVLDVGLLISSDDDNIEESSSVLTSSSSASSKLSQKETFIQYPIKPSKPPQIETYIKSSNKKSNGSNNNTLLKQENKDDDSSDDSIDFVPQRSMRSNDFQVPKNKEPTKINTPSKTIKKSKKKERDIYIDGSDDEYSSECDENDQIIFKLSARNSYNNKASSFNTKDNDKPFYEQNTKNNLFHQSYNKVTSSLDGNTGKEIFSGPKPNNNLKTSKIARKQPNKNYLSKGNDDYDDNEAIFVPQKSKIKSKNPKSNKKNNNNFKNNEFSDQKKAKNNQKINELNEDEDFFVPQKSKKIYRSNEEVIDKTFVKLDYAKSKKRSGNPKREKIKGGTDDDNNNTFVQQKPKATLLRRNYNKDVRKIQIIPDSTIQSSNQIDYDDDDDDDDFFVPIKKLKDTQDSFNNPINIKNKDTNNIIIKKRNSLVDDGNENEDYSDFEENENGNYFNQNGNDNDFDENENDNDFNENDNDIDFDGADDDDNDFK